MEAFPFQHMEEALRTLFSRQEAILDAVPEIIMEVDNNKVYTWANKPGMNFFGEDVIGKKAAFYFEGEQETYSIVQPLFNGSRDVIYLESYQRRRDGEKRLLAWWCRVLQDENGQVTGALSSAHDITERKRAEDALHRSEENFRHSPSARRGSRPITSIALQQAFGVSAARLSSPKSQANAQGDSSVQAHWPSLASSSV